MGAIGSMIVSVEGMLSKAGDNCKERTRQSPFYARRSSMSSADCFSKFASTVSWTTAVRACVCVHSHQGNTYKSPQHSPHS